MDHEHHRIKIKRGIAPPNLDKHIRELELYQFLCATKAAQNLLRRVHTLLYRGGFSDFSYILMLNKDSDQNLWMFPAKNVEGYVSNKWVRHDMMVQHVMMRNTPVLQSQISEVIDQAPFTNSLFEANKDIFRMVNELGFNDYYSFGFPSVAGNGRALFSISSKDVSAEDFQRRVNRQQRALHIVANALDAVGTRKFGFTFCDGHTSDRNRLINPAPLRLLSILASENCQLSEAAARLDISLSTANHHIAAAKKAFGANTTAAAIIHALRLGLIDIK